jgi:hypothetical protein
MMEMAIDQIKLQAHYVPIAGIIKMCQDELGNILIVNTMF